ncbi:MAG: hypothetical protein HYV63_03465 [Candidatus Schekmanbacteria bacterium]|nr:hypothetical protein [Candidatus Schekmanbacteria bacterium]
MYKLGMIVVLVSMLVGVARAPAQDRSLPNRHLRLDTYDPVTDGPQVIPEYRFATRFIGWVVLANDESVGPVHPLRTGDVSWRDFLHLEIRHDGERAESWLELTFDVGTNAKGLADPAQAAYVKQWLKSEKLHPSTELGPHSSVSIPFEVRLRDSCPLRLGAYEVVPTIDSAIARFPRLAWIARLPPSPEPAAWRVGLTPEEASLQQHRFELFRHQEKKRRMTLGESLQRIVRFYLAEAEKDPAGGYAVLRAVNFMTDWDEIERVLLQRLAWLEAGGRLRDDRSGLPSELQVVGDVLNQLRGFRAEGKTGDAWKLTVKPEFGEVGLLPRNNVMENTIVGGPHRSEFQGHCQMPMPE